MSVGWRPERARRPRVLAAALWAVWAAASPAAAQPAPAPRVAVSVGPDWLGRVDLGGHDAVETGNGSGPFTLFKTDSRLTGGVGVGGALAVRVTRALWIESTARYHAARLTTRVSADAEGAADLTVAETLQQIEAEVGGLWAPGATPFARRVQFYAVGGAGYVRQLHRGQTLVETGRAVYLGGGTVLRLPRRQGGTFRAVGLRLEARATRMTDGVSLDARGHTAPAATASFFLQF